jgi:two-component system, LytTR family, response regulator
MNQDKIQSGFHYLMDQRDGIIVIPTRSGFEMIRSYDLSYVVAARAYCTLHFHNKSCLLVSKSLKEISVLLNPKQFYRVHNSYLVNISSVLRIHCNDGDQLELLGGQTIPISKRRREAFMDFLTTRNIRKTGKAKS